MLNVQCLLILFPYGVHWVASRRVRWWGQGEVEGVSYHGATASIRTAVAPLLSSCYWMSAEPGAGGSVCCTQQGPGDSIQH